MAEIVINRDGLTDAELEEAAGLARGLIIRRRKRRGWGFSGDNFLTDVERYAAKRMLSRKMLEAVREAYRRENA